METIDSETISADRADARALIIRAARTLAEVKGIDGLTLEDVAAEAQLPSPVVFGQFVCKDDLLQYVAADSISTLTKSMGGIDHQPEEPKIEDAREGAVILTLPRPELTSEAPETMLEIARQVSAALSASSLAGDVLTAAGSERRAVRRTERARMMGSLDRGAQIGDVAGTEDRIDEAAKRSVETVSEETGVRTPGGVLARRLHALEHAMAETFARLEQTDKNSHTAAAIADDSAKHILKELAELVARVDVFETRQKAAAIDVNAAFGDANLRIQTVEGVVRAALVENSSVPTVEASTGLVPTQDTLAGAIKEKTQVRTHEQPPSVLPAFLASARASAGAAGFQKAAAQFAGKTSSAENRTHYIVAGLVVTAVFVAAAGVAFSQGVRDGRSEALRALALVTPPHATIYAADNTPLDHLTARAEAGDAVAELTVATKYIGDSAVARDPAAGFRWMSRAAQHGNPVAQYMLGTLFLKGVGTEKNTGQAMRWYEAAALQGNRKAMHDLAIAYAQGFGGVQNLSEAVRWLSRAANLGYVDSQFDLGVLYERGDGVPQSLLDAYKWYAIAGAQGDFESRSRVEALRTQLSPDDVAAAEHAADGFRALPYNEAANLPPKP